MERPYSLDGFEFEPQKNEIVETFREVDEQFAQLPALPTIADADLLTPDNPEYDQYVPGHNLRTSIRPALRALCKTPQSIVQLLDWIRANGLPFAIRSGGHSFEGFSQSPIVVVDTRRLNGLSFDAARQTVTVGAGAALGDVYKFLSPYGLAFVAGSCPTVGVAGHTLGGGFGLLGRTHGLAADNLETVTIIDARGERVQADKETNPDLFWACKGGGGGSFGIATEFCFRVHAAPPIVTFGVTWIVSTDNAATLFDAWQRWAPMAPNTINVIMKVGRFSDDRLKLRCIGQSTSSEAAFRKELRKLTELMQPSDPPKIQVMRFFEAVKHYAGNWNYQTVYFKGKSDYVVGVLGKDGISTLMVELIQVPFLVAICDAYGGAVASTAVASTAFPHRQNDTFCIQYYTQWDKPVEGAQRLRNISNVYQAMRPYVSGSSYVNYCDLDLPDWTTAYWGSNLPRLRQIKSIYDPDNLFAYPQSVPPVRISS